MRGFSTPGPKAAGRAWLVLAAWLCLAVFSMPAMAGDTPVRHSILAGAWYPEDPKELTAMVKGFLDHAKTPEIQGRLVALAVPHAGLVYSGPVAAYGFSLLKNQDFETVVLIGPSHRYPFSGVSLNPVDYETPLGRLPLDAALAQEILKQGAPLVTTEPLAHQQEHCLEIEMPFLQTVAPKIKIVPLLMGDQDMDTCTRLAQILAKVIKGKKVLLLASTDLSHFHPADKAQELDGRLVEIVETYDALKLHSALIERKIEACGGGALVTVMLASRALGADRAEVLKYGHSGETSGNNIEVVGYLAAAFTNSGRPPAASGSLKPEERKQLLSLARQSIMSAVDETEFKMPADLPEAFRRPAGCFVTIKKEGMLRGCIGHIVADKPLAETTVAMARAAALEDPRFPPLTKAELEGLSIEISVLTPFEPVLDVEEIEVGVHGLFMVYGHYQGLLLPQVPVEQGWDREEFLDQTCGKAGLWQGCWREDVQIFKFSALVFGENEH